MFSHQQENQVREGDLHVRCHSFFRISALGLRNNAPLFLFETRLAYHCVLVHDDVSVSDERETAELSGVSEVGEEPVEGPAGHEDGGAAARGVPAVLGQVPAPVCVNKRHRQLLARKAKVWFNKHI